MEINCVQMSKHHQTSSSANAAALRIVWRESSSARSLPKVNPSQLRRTTQKLVSQSRKESNNRVIVTTARDKDSKIVSSSWWCMQRISGVIRSLQCSTSLIISMRCECNSTGDIHLDRRLAWPTPLTISSPAWPSRSVTRPKVTTIWRNYPIRTTSATSK